MQLFLNFFEKFYELFREAQRAVRKRTAGIGIFVGQDLL